MTQFIWKTLREEKNNVCSIGLWGTLRWVLSTCRRISTNSLHQLYAFSMNAFKQEVVGGDCAEAIGVAGLLFDFCRCVFLFLSFNHVHRSRIKWTPPFRVEVESCHCGPTTFCTCGMWWNLCSKLIKIVRITVVQVQLLQNLGRVEYVGHVNRWPKLCGKLTHFRISKNFLFHI